MRYCSYCGQPLEPGSAFCHHCGAALKAVVPNADEIPVQETPVQEEPAPEKIVTIEAPASDENAIAEEKAFLEQTHRLLRWERKAWSIAGKVFLITGIVFAALFFLMGIIFLAVGEDVAVFGAVICAVIPDKIISLLGAENPEVIKIGGRMLMIYSIALPFLGFSSYVNMMYQSLGFVKGATFLASCRQGVYFIPAIIILPLLLGLNGVIASQSLADILTFLTSIPFCVFFLKKKKMRNDDS